MTMRLNLNLIRQRVKIFKVLHWQTVMESNYICVSIVNIAQILVVKINYGVSRKMELK